MPIATKIARYNKMQKLYIDEKEITLIEHLQQLRTEKKITKKKISNIIKQNDTWYSQIERNGKDDNRQKTIYRPDLVNIISIVKFGAASISDLGTYQKQSENYLDKVIKAIPLSESTKTLEWYEINKSRTPSEQERLFESLMVSLNKSIRQAYTNLPDYKKDKFLNCLKEMNSSLRLDACFLISLAGLPFSEFLYEADQNRIDALISNIIDTMDKIVIDSNNEKEIKTNEQYFELIYERIQDYIDISKYTRRNNYELLPPDKMTW